MKTCSACAETKDFALFPKNTASPDGRYSLCKACRKIRAAAWRARPEVKARETVRLKAVYSANRDDLLIRRAQRYASNKGATLAKNKEWRDKHLEKHRAQCRQWARDNPVAMRAITARRRAILKGAQGSYTASDVAAIFEQQRGLCVYCEADLRDGYHIDHWFPLSRGGSNDPSNIQLTCPTCNRRKADKLPHELPSDFGRAAP